MFFEDVAPGYELPSLTKGPINARHIMRWSAAIENWHPIHFDRKYAIEVDKVPDVLINGSWKQQLLMQLLYDWAGLSAWVLRLSLQYRGMDLPGSRLTAWGRVTGTEQKNGFGIIELDVGLRNQDGVDTTPGRATVAIQLRDGAALPYPFDPRILE